MDFEVYGRRDHPRARGEHSLILNTRNVSRGSSPRLRGTRPAPPAGKPAPPEESSSRLRGTPNETGRACPRRGIIPALAGNTQTAVVHMDYSRDHPRACGEHVAPPSPSGFLLGSSPRLRGTHVAHHRRTVVHGIIPALAGNTTCLFPHVLAYRDHPRACGEHQLLRFTAPADGGSSPRLRGTLLHHVEYELDFGIIPALAGNTAARPVHPVRGPNHPRACGEH